MYQVLLCPNKSPDFKDIPYPQLGSIKYDGFRFVLYKGIFYSRNMKIHANLTLPLHFKELISYSQQRDLVLDGELFDPTLPFHTLASFLRNQTTILPRNLGAYVFDAVPVNIWDNIEKCPYSHRYDLIPENVKNSIKVKQHLIKTPEEAKELFINTVLEGFEGIVLRNPNANYKHGRATIAQNVAYKYKQEATADGTIISINSRKEMKQDIPRTYQSTGLLEKVHKQEYFDETNIVGSFTITSEEFPGEIFSIGFGRGFPMSERKHLWTIKDKLIGRHIEFKYHPYNIKSSARSGLLIRFRPDKD